MREIALIYGVEMVEICKQCRAQNNDTSLTCVTLTKSLPRASITRLTQPTQDKCDLRYLYIFEDGNEKHARTNQRILFRALEIGAVYRSWSKEAIIAVVL